MYYIVLREDIVYTPDSFFNIITKSVEYFSRLSSYSPESPNKYQTYFKYNLRYLDLLESSLINDGIIFSWIDDKAILISTEKSIDDDYFYDCLSLSEYSEFRANQFGLTKL